ncbi:hypothetical protein TTRE_0000053101 [Trichuris trichiura]|uniref:Uncharacterized protein n=1 Tax=Trichuris trichiura TaxID=36087 RepID=A0A077YW44_TRITR|nr:hypothetical protein TTRE_0000053101 [Trichuris trichiura]
MPVFTSSRIPSSLPIPESIEDRPAKANRWQDERASWTTLQKRYSFKKVGAKRMKIRKIYQA